MSKIEWTSDTWCIIGGCWPESAGCANCYAVPMSRRLGAMAEKQGESASPAMRKYIGTVKNGRFTGKINLDYEALKLPYTWKKSKMVFVQSMGDLFHEDVPTAFIQAAFKVMNETQHITYQVLTKRTARMAAIDVEWTPNIWAMTSVENQKMADLRIPLLLQVDAKIRGLSMEPLLECVHIDNDKMLLLDFIIAGGESGPKARPMPALAAQHIRNICEVTDTKFFFKQWGACLPLEVAIQEFKIGDYHNPTKSEHHNGLEYVRMGKKKAGRLLNGRTWDELPEPLTEQI